MAQKFPTIDSTHDACCLVLSIPELLENVFIHSDKTSNSVNVQVCKFWFDVCRPVLWQSLDNKGDSRKLVETLAPLGLVEEEETFLRMPLAADWERFQIYSRLIRSITLEHDIKLQAAFRIISSMRPVINLFPNLRSLELEPRLYLDDIPVQPSALFMHSNVTRFVIEVQYARKTNLWADTISRMTMLVRLEIKGEYIHEDLLAAVVKSLRCLEIVVLPFLNATAFVIESLWLHPRLQEIRSFGFVDDVFDDLDIHVPSFPEGAFPVLRTLTIAAWANNFPQFLGQRFFPENIHGLHLETPELDEEDVQATILAISKCRDNIEEISLFDIGHGSADFYITFSHLKPLLCCAKLTTLRLRHRSPLDLTNNDIEQLARSLPQIERLFLNEDPSPYASHHPAIIPAITMDVLPILAFHCRCLRSLGIYINATVPSTFVPMAITPFGMLDSLHVGTSWIAGADIEPVALFLAQVLPKRCTIQLPWEDSTTASSHPWFAVNRILPFFMKMKEIGIQIGKSL
ncbi:hypothetical protein Hypma_005437 [Hypsizygus marmoreus]|uniref:F-box domain-containing protein n=1 Tax=Hypsizygus marmoreus TaxID=39966 RepID=A0A369J3S3_HYPMA|nr:hypothetical protein Hypma_005437 [Hypsizygus marmoreus]